MAHFAHVTNGIVDQVIVAEQEFIDSGAVGSPSEWIQTSYNTYGNQHTLGGTPLRGNYAGIGYHYDAQEDIFYAPQPYASWLLSPQTALWEAPVAMPADGKAYEWDEATTSWKEVVAA